MYIARSVRNQGAAVAAVVSDSRARSKKQVIVLRLMWGTYRLRAFFGASDV